MVPRCDSRDAPELQITFPGRAEEVRHALQRLMASPLLSGLPDDLGGTAEIVLAEVLNNIVEHAYAAHDGQIVLRLSRLPDGLPCEVCDTGLPMPGLSLPEGRFQPLDTLADLPEGGFGWYLIRSLTEGLAYRRHGGLNCLSFRLSTRQSDA